MAQNGLDFEQLKQIRQQIHMNPETGFNEIETQKLLKEVLIQMGIGEKNIKICAKTGLIVDIEGQKEIENDQKSDIKVICLRADIDALPIQETTAIEHKSRKNNVAHSCGHDGHIAMVLGCIQVLMKKIKSLGKDRKVRVLFQPAEEGPGGAEIMIKEGCLEGVDEVYGMHNIPNFKEGQIRVKDGEFFAQSTIVRLQIKGIGGHGSVPHLLTDSINCATQILSGFNTIKSRFIDSKQNIVFTICQIQSGETYNVFSDQCSLQGTIRSYDQATLEIVINKIKQIVHHYSSAMGCDADLEIQHLYPPIINHREQSQYVREVAEKWLGDGYFSQQDLPLTASEDFSYFLQNKPGSFFVLGTNKYNQKPFTLHTSSFDFNDDMIYYGAYFWCRLIESRLNTNILSL